MEIKILKTGCKLVLEWASKEGQWYDANIFSKFNHLGTNMFVCWPIKYQMLWIISYLVLVCSFFYLSLRKHRHKFYFIDDSKLLSCWIFYNESSFINSTKIVVLFLNGLNLFILMNSSGLTMFNFCENKVETSWSVISNH